MQTVRVFTVVAATMAAAVAAQAQEQDWQIDVGTTAGTNPEVRLDSQGRPHVAYMIEAFGGGVFHGLKDEAGDWVVDTVCEGYFYAPLDMTIDDDDRIHIAYHDHDNEDIVCAAGRQHDWSLEIVANPGHDGWDGRIAIDPAGDVHIVSIDPSQFGSSSGVEWAVRRNGVWAVEEIGSGRIPYEFGVALAVDDDGRLHVAYHDGERDLNMSGTGADLLYAVLEAGAWKIEAVHTDGDIGKFPSIALDSSGRPHITYLERTGEETATIRYAYDNGEEWIFDSIDALDDLELAFIGARRTTAVALDEDDNAHVAYSDRSVLRFARRMEQGWEIEDVTGPIESGQFLA